MTVPTTRPRWSSDARVAANGTRIWADTEHTPAMATATMRRVISGAAAAPKRARAARARMAGTSRRRMRMSPSGTMSASPIPYPTCDAVTMRPAVPEPVLKSREISGRRGCA